MKKLLIFLLSIGFFININSQIVGAEYFIDGLDPGVGNATVLTVTSGNTINELLSVPTTGLADGIHVLHIRVKGTNNVWSLYKRAYFYMQPSPTNATAKNIVSAEYFIDSEQAGGVGGQSTLAVTPGLTTNELLAIPSVGLSNGTHILHIRVKDANNVWSLYKRAYFYVYTPNLPATSIVAAEYFFGSTVGDDPGVGNATALTVTQGMTVNENYTIPVPAGLINGDYYLHIRVKDQDGTWSLYKRAVFTIDNVLSVEEIDPSVFKLHPNPSKDVFYIDFQRAGEYSLSVFDVTGKELYQQRQIEQQYKVDLSKYAAGIYYLKIRETATNKVQNIKIIKE